MTFKKTPSGKNQSTRTYIAVVSVDTLSSDTVDGCSPDARMLEAVGGAALLQLSSGQQLRGQTASSPLLLQQSQLGKRRGTVDVT
jgi:hypothetical protein